MRVAVALLSSLLSACGGAGAEVAETHTTTSVSIAVTTSGNSNPEPIAPMASRAVRVTWSAVRSSASCFFFSGPESLGRDDHLGALATLTLTPPNGELVFEGPYPFVGPVLGSSFSGVRESRHDFGGTWTTRERITLSASGGAWTGTYHYDELDPSTRAIGSCHIDAVVVVTPR